jgi:hypothetical protein
MNALKKTALATVFAGISSISWAFVPSVPPGWTLVKSLNTVKIYQETGKENYVQVLNISGGATVELVQEYGGVNQGKIAYNRYTVSQWWNKVSNPGSIVNGEFFFLWNPAPISFPMRVNNTYIQGYDNTLTTSDRQLEIIWNTVDVFPYNLSRIQNGPNPLVISGLSPFANKSSTSAVGRTFLCSRYVGGTSPWIMYVITAKAETQANVRTRLQNWGCDVNNKTVMLDGGGSTALAYKNGTNLKVVNGLSSANFQVENRPVPQVLVVRGN